MSTPDSMECNGCLRRDTRITELEAALAERTQELDALAAGLSTFGQCKVCNGYGSFEALTGEDDNGNIASEEVPCECGAVDPVRILAARDEAQRKAGAVAALTPKLWDSWGFADAMDALPHMRAVIERGEVKV
jgi:hypothetical protein